MQYKFQVGDKVKIVKNGEGCNRRLIGVQVIISALGAYCGGPGYLLKDQEELGDNCNQAYDRYDGMIGEDSFELVESAVEVPLEVKLENQIGAAIAAIAKAKAEYKIKQRALSKLQAFKTQLEEIKNSI